jgi:two-component system sensor histidine kinase UhpB
MDEKHARRSTKGRVDDAHDGSPWSLPPGQPSGVAREYEQRLEEASHPAEASYRALVEHSPVISYTAALQPDAGTNYLSPQAKRILGYEPQQMADDPDLWIRSVHPDDRRWVMAEYERCRAKGLPFKVEYRFRTGDGRLIWLRDEAVFVPDRFGKPALIQGVMFDITERKAQEQRLRDGTEQQARLLEQLVSSQEDERKRIQMDIHDGPLQSLAISLMALDRAARRRARGEDELADKELAFVRESLVETIGELRNVLADLSQDVLTTQGLVPALRKYMSRFAEVTGIHTRLDANVQRRLSPDYELLIYRLAQESLANVRKHAAAYNVTVSLAESGGTLHLTVRDDGLGFNTEEVERTAGKRKEGENLGLRSMRERARAVGGDLHIFSASGRGTALHFTCPLPAA